MRIVQCSSSARSLRSVSAKSVRKTSRERKKMKVISWKNADFTSGEIKKSAMSQNSHAKEVQITMPAGTATSEHKAPFDISVQVLCGEIEFKALGESVRLAELDMVSLEAGKLLLVSAVKDSIARLSMAIDTEKMKDMPPKK